MIRTLRGSRVALDMTLADVAERIGVNPETVRDWECGMHSPSLANFTAYANTLGYRIRLEAE